MLDRASLVVTAHHERANSIIAYTQYVLATVSRSEYREVHAPPDDPDWQRKLTDD